MTDISSEQQQNSPSSNENSAHRNRRIVLVDSSSAVARQSQPAELKQYVTDSISYNAALIGVSLLKVLTSASVLAFSTSKCSKSLVDYISYMICHDVFYVLSLILRIRTMIKGTFAFVSESVTHNESQNQASQQDRISFFPFGEILFNISDEAERKNKFTSAIATTAKTIYYGLFVYGQVLYLQSSSACAEITPTIKNLALLYIIFGYFYIGMPVIFVVGACLCLPVVLISVYFFSKSDRVPTGDNVLNKLPVITYSKPLPGGNECSICIMEYNEGDQVIQLKCSPMHHFHEACVKKWLRINGLCPVCRHRIDGSPEKFSEVLRNGAIQAVNNVG